MSLTQALNTAVAGLRVTQAGLSIVSANVANAETPGYVRKTAQPITTTAGEFGVSVRIAAVNRELDIYLQRQLRVESSGGAYAGLRADFYQRLQQLYGEPGSDSALETIFNNFTGALQTLATSPESSSARFSALSAGQVLAQHLNGMTGDIQALRSDAELGLSDSVKLANEAMAQIARINQQLGTSTAVDSTTAVLLDQRDFYLDRLAQLMDIRVVETDHSQVNVFTNSGIQLVGTTAAALQFDAQGTMMPASQWSADPTKRSVGTVVLKTSGGDTMDLIANGAFRSGKIAGLIEMRDQVLVEAQAQLDQIAAAMARALSDRTVNGTAATVGLQTGFDVDIGSLLSGNTVQLTYTEVGTGAQRKVTIVRVNDPATLPLPDSTTPDANDKVVGVDFTGGLASVVAQLNSALGYTGLQFANPAGTTLRVLDDGTGNKVNVDALSATSTVTSLTGGSAELPFFLDGATPYSGAITANGTQSLGLAARIVVNQALVADPSRLVVYQTAPLTLPGDQTRPNFLYQRMTGAALSYAPQAGIGTASSPFSGTLPSYLRQMVSQQGEAASAAQSLKEGQEVVVNSLQQRFAEGSGVNIDEEMARLLNLQMAYGANARVMTTVKDMLDLLMRI